MKYADNNGTRIAYQVCGRGEPLVLIHGWSNEGRYWDEFGYVTKLLDEFQVVLPDLRGHGESETPANKDYSDATFASDVIAVLDDLSIDSAHVFGYSLGGWVVFELAATFPSRINSVIAGGAHPYEEDVSPIKEFTPTGIVTAWDELGAPLSSASLDHLASTSHQQLIDVLEDRVDLSGRLMSLTMPFLVICGTEDLRFEEMRRFARERDGCQFVALEGHDHLSAWLQTDLVLAPVLDFLGQ